MATTHPSHAPTHGAERGLKRLEGFSDAVFAIVLTLLIVEVKPPGSPDGPEAGANLWHAIAGQWREHLALVLSFLAVGVYWLQHHYSGRIYARSDHWFGAINLGFLLAVAALPYPIRVWCFHLGTEHERTASIVLAIGLAAPALFWMAKWFYALPGRRLMDERLTDDFLRQMTRRYGGAVLVQLVGVLVTFVMPRLGVAIMLAVLLFFLFPQPKPRYKPGQEPKHESGEAKTTEGAG